jgi:hypothetical protein
LCEPFNPLLSSSAYRLRFQNQHALILCIINGDELVFNREYMVQGYQGGRAAAQQLTQRIAAQLSCEEVHVFGRLSFWITIYFNKAELAEDLSANNICPLEQFHAFITVSHPRSCISIVAIHSIFVGLYTRIT